MYLSISGMRNSTSNVATGKSSYPFQLITPSKACNNLIIYSILSMRVWVSSVTCAGATTEYGVVSVCPCRTNAPAYGVDWDGGSGDGGTVWSYYMVWLDGGDGGIVESCGMLPWIGIGWAWCPSILCPNPKIASLSDAMVSLILTSWSTVAYWGSISLWTDGCPIWLYWSDPLTSLSPTLILSQVSFRLWSNL